MKVKATFDIEFDDLGDNYKLVVTDIIHQIFQDALVSKLYNHVKIAADKEVDDAFKNAYAKHVSSYTDMIDNIHKTLKVEFE